MTYINSMNNEETNKAILRIFPKINIEKITEFIDSIYSMSLIRKEFYKKIISLRYEILKKVYNKLIEL